MTTTAATPITQTAETEIDHALYCTGEHTADGCVVPDHHPDCTRPRHRDTDDCTLARWKAPSGDDGEIALWVQASPPEDCGPSLWIEAGWTACDDASLDKLIAGLRELIDRAEAWRGRLDR